MLAGLLPAPREGRHEAPVDAHHAYGARDELGQLCHYRSLEQDYRVATPHQRPFILVVDDDHFIGESLAELLAEVGFRVEVAFSGQDAFDVARHEAPVLILTDFMMPDCDGERLAHRLRADPQTRAIPLALMSSARPRLSSLGGIPFLPKPFDIEDVLTFVKRYVTPDYPHGEG